jgi:hypothetical protein
MAPIAVMKPRGLDARLVRPPVDPPPTSKAKEGLVFQFPDSAEGGIYRAG